jgi:Nucleoside-diphosphate-sugar epimerases
MIDPKKKVFVTGHRGLVGSAIMRQLLCERFRNIVTAPHSEIDLTDETQARWFFSVHRPAYVFHCAAWVGGIMAHTKHTAQAILNNTAIQNNVLSLSAEYGVEKLLFLGSACAYPRLASCPLREEYLGTGPLEESNKGYALCKILGHELCKAFRREQGCNFISCIPTNLYGLNDNYHPENSHVIPGMIHKFHWAKLKNEEVTLWGSGNPVREFLWAGDLAEACMYLMKWYDGDEPLNVGSGEHSDLMTLALKVADAVGYTGCIRWDASKPDGTPIRFLDNSKINSLGWRPKISLASGLPHAYRDFLSRQ